MQNSLSLAVIVKPSKEEAEGLDKCLASVSKYVNEICVTITGESKEVEAVANKYNAKISNIEWEDDFSKARNYNFKKCTGDWILWLDADDTLVGGENLDNLITGCEVQNISGVAFKYKYNHDKNGNCIDEHWKMQLLKNDGHFEWQGAIHEDPIQKRGVNWSKSDDCLRVHNTNSQRTLESYKRNLRILEKEVKKNDKEPRTWFYLGRTYFATKEYQKAIDCLMKYLSMSGWDEERYEATLLVGQSFFMNGQNKEALEWYNKAVLEKEEYPDAYIHKGQVYLKQEDYKKAIVNFENAINKNAPEGNTYFNPMFYQRDLVGSMALCYMHIGQFDKAIGYAKAAYQVDSKNEEIIELYRLVAHIKDKVDTAKKIGDIARRMEKTGEADKIKALLHSAPKDLLDNPIITSLKMKYLPPKKWGDNSLVIYCGNSPEVWSPDSVNKGGIGGSETAVVELAKRLTKKGWNVTVFSNCGASPEGDVYNGVTYRNYWDFNFQDEYNLLWIWRLPEMLDYDIKCKGKLLDLHDVMNPLDFTEARLENVDKIMVKSEYHKGLLPNVPDEKFAIIGNGIGLEKFKGGKNNKNKFIYASTPNRGLDLLLEFMWDKIKEEIPDAELHVFYGWKTFYELEKHNPERMAWMEKVKKLMEKPGVINHGRVGQKELAEHEQDAGFWLYPTYFPEIHCITACEVQAAGCIPVTSGYAALEETQRVGIKLDGDVYDPEWQDNYIKEFVKLYKDDDRIKQLSEQAKQEAKQFSWGLVADKWDEVCQKLKKKY